MEKQDISELVHKYMAAFLANDRAALEDYLSDDFTFTSPRDDHIDKALFFERCLANSVKIRAQHIEKVFAQGNEALVRYRAELVDGTQFRNTEYIRVEGGKLKEVQVYFGAAISPE